MGYVKRCVCLQLCYVTGLVQSPSEWTEPVNITYAHAQCVRSVHNLTCVRKGQPAASNICQEVFRA